MKLLQDQEAGNVGAESQASKIAGWDDASQSMKKRLDLILGDPSGRSASRLTCEASGTIYAPTQITIKSNCNSTAKASFTLKLRSTIPVFRYLGEISAEITRKDDPECPPYVLASPMIYLTRNKNSENACCTEQMFGYFEGDLVKAVDAYYELDACADRRGLVERIINLQRLPVEK